MADRLYQRRALDRENRSGLIRLLPEENRVSADHRLATRLNEKERWRQRAIRTYEVYAAKAPCARGSIAFELSFEQRGRIPFIIPQVNP